MNELTKILDALHAARFRCSNERALQESIGEALEGAGIAFQREKALSRADRPDFLLCGGRIVLEAKLKYPKKAIYRQLVRYAAHEGVETVILVTGTAMGMPAAIGDVPVYVVSAGMGNIGC